MVRAWCVLCILTWKCASRHNGVQLFISHLASWLRTRRFSEPTFRLSGATNHWKNAVFRDFLPTFSRICIFFLLTLSLLIFLFSLPQPCSCFSSVHIVGSLTSKLPSIMSTSKFSSIQRCFQRSRNGIVMTYLNSFGSKKMTTFFMSKKCFLVV